MSLKQQSCIVTGATEGIGRAIAHTLGQEGAKLSICARTATRVDELVTDLRHQGITAFGQACDVSNEAQVAAFVSAAEEANGPTTILVNNAGLAHFGPVDEMSIRDFDETMAVNVRGVFLTTRAVLPTMKRQGGGAIVNIASLAGRNAVPGAAAYAASKHAVLGFAKSAFAEVRKYGIRIATICPGSVVTPFFEKSGSEIANPERKLQPQDVADAVLSVLRLPERALLSELDLRPTTP